MSDAPLWTCPVCGQRFVTRNMPHSCQVVELDRFFEGATPGLRELFDLYVAAARENGPVTVNATKSRIALQVACASPGSNVHQLRLAEPDDVDPELAGWLAEAYAIGEQRHVSDPGWVRRREPPDWVHVPSTVR